MGSLPTRWWRWFTKCHTHVRGKSSHDQRSSSQPGMHLHRGRVTANPSSPTLTHPRRLHSREQRTEAAEIRSSHARPRLTDIARSQHPLSTSNLTPPPHSSPSILLSKPRLSSPLGTAHEGPSHFPSLEYLQSFPARQGTHAEPPVRSQSDDRHDARLPFCTGDTVRIRVTDIHIYLPPHTSDDLSHPRLAVPQPPSSSCA